MMVVVEVGAAAGGEVREAVDCDTVDVGGQIGTVLTGGDFWKMYGFVRGFIHPPR